MSASDDKKALRDGILARRRLMGVTAGRDAGARARGHFMQGLEALGLDPLPSVAAAYWPVAGEFDARFILSELHGRKVVCALPVVVGRGRPLLFRRWKPAMALEQAGFGLWQPPADSPEAEPDLLLVPLIAFDRDGYRLGHGAGYYDLTLAALRAKKRIVAVGIGFAAQQVDRLPRETHDQRLDAVVTEKGLTLFSSAALPPVGGAA